MGLFKQTETSSGHGRQKRPRPTIGEIPEDWRIVTIPDVASNFDNKRKPLSSAERSKIRGQYPYYGAAGIIDYVNDFKYEGNYLLIAEDGTVTSDGNRPMLQLARGKFWVSNHAHVLQCKSYKDTLFLYYQLKNTSVVPFITGAVQPKLSQENLNKIKFLWIENDDERGVITKILFDLDEKIELNHQMNNTLESIAQAIFKRWFVDFEFPDKNGKPYRLSGGNMIDSELGKIPEGWRVDTIYCIAEVIYGAPFASNLFNSKGEGKPLIRIRDLLDEKPEVFTTEVHPKGYLVKPGNIVVGMDGEFRAYFWGGKESWLNQRVCVFVPKTDYSTPYVLLSITKPLAEVEATETATTVIHIGKNDIDRFKVVIPDGRSLRLFNQLTEPLYEKIVTDKQESISLVEIRDSLLPRLMSGRIRINGNMR